MPRRIAVDFEFKIDEAGSNPPRIRCMVAVDQRSGETWSMWEDELYATSECPFPAGPDVQIICFQAKAEGRCFATLKWWPAARCIDLFVERLRLLNPAPWPSLLDTLEAYGLPCMPSAHKELMRQLIMHSDIFTTEQRAAILKYCREDVLSTLRLMEAMDAAGHIRWDQAEWRGTCNFCYGYIEDAGVPIDTATYRQFTTHRTDIMLGMIASAQAEHGFDVYDGATFKHDKFAVFLEAHRIYDWPRTPFGSLAVKDEIMGRLVKRYPIVTPIHELRLQLDQLRLMALAIGDDGRNRFDFKTFGTLTMRCTPGTAENIMAGPRWMRGQVWADPRGPYVVAVVDYVAQEFGYGARQSSDLTMQGAYREKDVHMGTAIATKIAPPGSSKSTHPKQRKIGKEINFCLMYGGGVRGLARKLRCSPYEAAEHLANAREAFAVFDPWAAYQVAEAQCRGWMESPRGWLVDVAKVLNPRTLRNWHMQTGGSEMLQAVIVILMITYGVRIVCTMHDAIMVELPLATWRADLDLIRTVMEDVSEIVTGGLRIRTDEHVLMPGDRLISPDDDEWGQWRRVVQALGLEEAA